MKAIRPTGHHKIRRSRNWTAYEHDPYKPEQKLENASWCGDCGAVFSDGRWRWGGVKDEAKKRRCPACQRTHDQLPAGYVSLGGAFLVSHRDEILQTVRNLEQREKSEHPLQRIMHITEQGDEVLITTTDVHLARGIGEALHHAYHGTVEATHNPEEDLVRVHWSRD